MRKRRGLFRYVAVYECTPGRDAQGHVHIHVWAELPGWDDWSEWTSAWRRAAGDQGAVAHYKKGYGKDGKRAWYLAKYMGKTSDPAAGPALLGRIAGQWYRRRQLTASHGLWNECRPVDRPSPWRMAPWEVRILDRSDMGPDDWADRDEGLGTVRPINWGPPGCPVWDTR